MNATTNNFPSSRVINQAATDYANGRRTWPPTWTAAIGRTGIATKIRIIRAETRNGDLIVTTINGTRVNVRHNDMIDV